MADTPDAAVDLHIHLSRIDVSEVTEQNMVHLQMLVGYPLPYVHQGQPLQGLFARIHTGLDKESAEQLGNELLQLAENLKPTSPTNITIAQNLSGVEEAVQHMSQFKGS